MRVLSIWSSLAERYNRKIDEDDIVDIRTGEIVKDRGVLSELPKRYNFGDFADRDDDPAINTDLGDEAADNLAEDEEDNDDEDGAEETDASPAPNGFVSSQITRLAPLRPATSSSDADDLRRFLKAEAIRRELDGGDDSSEEEFSILPPRSTPAKRTMAPVRKTQFATRAKPRPLQTPAPGTESEDEFAVQDSDRNDFHYGHRARRTPSPEVPPSIPSPPPPSSSPGPSSSFSLPSSPLLSRTPLHSNWGPQARGLFGSPTPKRRPLTSAARRTLEDSLNEIDIEFPPPQPRAPSVFGGRVGSAFIIDLSLSDTDTEDKRPRPSAKATINPKPITSEPRMARETGSALISKRPVPFVLIQTKPPAPSTPASTTIASGPASTSIDPDPISPSRPGAPREPETLLKKGRPRTRSSKDRPPDPGDSQNSKRRRGSKAKLVKGMSREECGDDEHGFGSEPSPTRRTALPKSSSGVGAQVTTPEPDPKPESTCRPAVKPRSDRPTRLTATAKPKSKTPRKPPEGSVDSDGRSSPPLPPSPSPAPPIRPRVRPALKRKRIVSSGSSSGEERGSPKLDPVRRSSPPGNGSRACAITSEAIDVDRDDPEAGGVLSCWISFVED